MSTSPLWMIVLVLFPSRSGADTPARMGARKPGLSFDLLAALENPRARLELVCRRCGRQRRTDIIKAVAWLRRQGVRRLHWLEAAQIETFAAADPCPDCRCTSWRAAVLILPDPEEGPVAPRYLPGR